ncbi:MAG: hypothetical protein EHM67_11115, partial [Hyphomicrobiaceae bacterium]
MHPGRGLRHVKRAKYECLCFPNVASCLEEFKAQNRDLGEGCDVLISDVKMPGKNGPELLPEVRALFPWTTGDTARRIAEYVAALIPDNSTVQLGVDRMAQALPAFLKGKHDLGIHAEVVGDGIVELFEAGAITGTRKSSDRGKIVCSMCLGTERLFGHVRNNPAFCFRSAEYESDPAVISRQRNMVAVGLASEVDLMGQVCAHTPETGFSGMASHADFVHGVAYLHGKSMQERAMALISIAHPDFRARLLREAIERRYVSSE